MSLAKRLADKAKIETRDFYSEKADENIPVAQLTIGGLAEVNERIDIDLWELILDTFSANIEDAKDAENPEDVDVDQKAMISFLRGLNYRIQSELMWESFKLSIGKETTKEQADKIYSVLLDDDQQMQALMFTLQGVQEEDVKEQAENTGDGTGNSTSDKDE